MTILLYITLTIQIGYWYFLFNKTSLIDNYTTNILQNKTVTIIICSKNELQSLQNNIPAIQRQNHPYCTLMVADDFSQDGSINYLKTIDNEKMEFRYFKVKKNKLGKKQALKEAISLCKSDHLLLTDADCQPLSPNWAKLMTNPLSNNNVELVLGYSPYLTNTSKLSIWVHFEAWLTAVQYFSYALVGLPYMGVGRNLAYNRQFISPKELDRHDDLSSGDDDLTVNYLADKHNTAVCLHKDSFVYTTPPSSYKAYFDQKKRHYSTANRYKWIHIVLLSLYSLSQLLFYALLLFLLFQGSVVVAIICYLIRLLLIFPVMIKWRKILNGEFNLLIFPILDFIQAIHYLIFSFAVLIPTKQKW